MAEVIAICNDCDTVFGFGFHIGVNATATFVGSVASPCPNCGGEGRIPDGVYQAVGSVLKELAAPERTLEDFKRLLGTLSDAADRQLDHQRVSEEIREKSSEFRSLADVLPRTRTDLYAFITIVITTLTLLIFATDKLWPRDGLSQLQVEALIERAIEQSFDDLAEKNRASSTDPDGSGQDN